MEPEIKTKLSTPLIFLDMDGVLCDFVGAAIRAHRMDLRETLASWPRGEFEISNVLGLSDSQFWGSIDNAWPFWQALLPTPYCDELVDLCRQLVGVENVYVASKPHTHASSFAGKSEWLLQRGIKPNTRAMLGGEKHLLSAPGRILVNDNDRNCELWREAGGSSVLVPQIWNSRHAEADAGKTWEVVANELRTLVADLQQQ